jgi:hypothetical protein
VKKHQICGKETSMGRTTTSADWLDQISEDMDLRKRREDSLTDLIVRRAHWLNPADCELILATFRDGRSASSIADLVGGCPRQIRRRIKLLVSRLRDPRVAYVVAHHEKWSNSRKAIARSLFIEGKSMRESTDELGVSFYSVRKHREAIDAMCHAALSSSQLRGWRSSDRAPTKNS